MQRDVQQAYTEAKWMVDLITRPDEAISATEREQVARKTVTNFADHVNKGFLQYRKSSTLSGDYAMTEWNGRGSILKDMMGRELIDAMGGYGLYNYGVAHPDIIRAAQAQLARSPQYSQEMLDPVRAQLARVLALLTPGDIQYGFFANSGTEAVEGAMKLARLYTGKRGFISMLRAFHGKTFGALSLLGKSTYREPVGQLLDGVGFVPFGDAKAVEEALASAKTVGQGVAAVIAEPIQGEAGAIVPPDDFWPRLRELCDYYGVLLIADEVQTGFGRTGKIFGVDHWNVAPDIITMGKALGGGVIACSAFMSTPKIWSVLEPNPFLHSTTTGGNPIACAAALAAITVLLSEDIPGQAARKGKRLMAGLTEIKERYPDMLKEVRGKGLLLGLRFASNEIGYQAVAGLFKRGVMVAGTLLSAETIRVEPALNIPDELIDEILDRLDDTLMEMSHVKQMANC